MAEAADLEAELIADIDQFQHDPEGYADYAFPWGEPGPLEKRALRRWQREEMRALGEHLQNPETRHDVYQLAAATGHGVGKSALIAMITCWALDTFEDARVVCTANTDTQLKTKTVPEVGKWARMRITAHWTDVRATSIKAVDPEHSEGWRCDFTPWSEHRPESFAGLHNEGRRIVVIMDEASAIPDIIWETVEGALTDADTEIIWIAFGNPTRNSGRFRECFRTHGKYWRQLQLDSRTVEGTNTKYLNRIIEQYGEDSDQARIRVKGQFPNASAYQHFATDKVEGAMARVLKPEQFDFAPKIISVDPAWTGEDLFVIGLRQGLDFRFLEVHPKNDNDLVMATRIAALEDEHGADAVFIDQGYGTGLFSAGQAWGRNWLLVAFSSKSALPECFNKRSEMYELAKRWLSEGGSLPSLDGQNSQWAQALYNEMVGIEVVPNLDGLIRIPAKEDIKEEIGHSPDFTDCLVISFAYPVLQKRPTDAVGLPMGYGGKQDRYDPISHELETI